MKKKDFLVVVGAFVLSASLFAEVNKEKQIRDLVLENVEALSDNEPITGYEGDEVCFEWNGQIWNGKRDGSTSNWFPQFQWCKYLEASGHQVICAAGSGNCWNGTNCIKD